MRKNEMKGENGQTNGYKGMMHHVSKRCARAQYSIPKTIIIITCIIMVTLLTVTFVLSTNFNNTVSTKHFEESDNILAATSTTLNRKWLNV